MHKARPLFAALLLLTTVVAQDPEPTTQPTPAIRLVYEFPIDAMQRAQQGNAKFDLEAIIANTVEAIRGRVGKESTVTRAAATTVHVDVPKDHPDLRGLRRKVELVGALDMQIVATADYEVDGEALDLEAERKQLQAWLDAGGSKKLREDPRAIATFRAKSEQVRWVSNVIRPNPDRPGQWGYSLQLHAQMKSAVVPIYTDEQWSFGNVPKDMDELDDPFLIELVALDIRERGFSDADLDRKRVSVGRGFRNTPAINYAMIATRAAEYSDFSEKHIRRGCAIVVDDILQSAPIFMARIPGRGIIEGHFSKQEADDLALALRTGRLATAPVLVRQETIDK